MNEFANPAVRDHDRRARRAIGYLGNDPANWVIPRNGMDHDVAIIGGGQNGIAAAFALRRLGIGNVTVIEAASEGRQGVWRHPARMNGLRTPKNAPGPEFGIAELSFRYWYEARFGEAAYDALPTIARTDWADYLDWFRRIVDIPVRLGTRLDRLEPEGEHFRLHLDVDGIRRTETARKVLLVAGIVSFGGVRVPDLVRDSLPRHVWAHTSEDIDFEALRGKRIAVLGAAASAFDAAAVALETGASDVHLFSRRDQVVSAAGFKARSYPGALHNYPDIPDADRWRYNVLARRTGAAPPRDAILRVARHDNFHLHLRSPWQTAAFENNEIHVQASGEKFAFDYLIVGTGYSFDPRGSAVLTDFADEIAMWRDRHVPEAGLEDDDVGAYPYLGPSYQLSEKYPGQAPYLKNLHVFTASGTVSFGRPIGDIPSIHRGIPLIAAGISHDLFFDDYPLHLGRTLETPKPDFDDEIYANRVWRGPK